MICNNKKCDHYASGISVVLSPLPEFFLHECSNCGWWIRVPRQVPELEEKTPIK